MPTDILFQPLQFRNLTIKNRILRGNIGGTFDHYDGTGSHARLNWEEKFARRGVGAILSSFVAVSIRGRIMPRFATIESDERIPFWREVGRRVHVHDCRYIMQLSHCGRQQYIKGIENAGRRPLSSTNRTDFFHGIECQAMSITEIHDTVTAFAASARRARDAGLDGIELHACNGYLLTQFLSSAINTRTDEYGGSLENRARLLVDIICAIRREVGSDFHLQVKINAVDNNDALYPWKPKGNTLDETGQICQWAEQAGVDAIHVSSGSLFPHPRNPPGLFPVETAADTYDAMLSEGRLTKLNYLLFNSKILRPLFLSMWYRSERTSVRAKRFEGVNIAYAAAIKARLKIPVLCGGGFQNPAVIRHAIAEGTCDGVTIARPLVANPNLVEYFLEDTSPPAPCSYCNRCLFNVLKHPMGCYDVSRYEGNHEAMVDEILSVFKR